MPLDYRKPEPLVSDDEVKAAKGILDQMSALAGREQPVPDALIRFMLEEAAMIRTGMKKPGAAASPS